MAKCAICEKAAHFGNAVSHSHRRSNKIWRANVKSVRVKTTGGSQKMYVCTSEIRLSGESLSRWMKAWLYDEKKGTGQDGDVRFLFCPLF